MGLREDYRRHKRGGGGGKYQGKEFTTHFQANSEEELDEMVREAGRASERMGTGPVEEVYRRRDPDGGFEAIVRAHNWNPLKWVKEKFAKHKEETEKEREYRRRRKRGEVPTGELSPKERREQVEANRRQAEEVAKAAQRTREAERKRRPQTIRAQATAFQEGQAAEERARVLETELYGAPYKGDKFAVTRDPATGRETSRRRLPEEGYALRPEETIEYGPPIEIIRDKWGREIGREPLTAKRREERAKLELAHKRITEKGLVLIEERYKEAAETLRERRVAKRRKKILGPAEAVVKGVAGTVETVGRTVGGIGFRPEPYRIAPPPVIPTPRTTPMRPFAPAGPTPRLPDLSALRRLQTQPTGSLRISLFPTSTPTRKKPKGRNTYNDNLRKMRRQLFGR